LGRRKLYGLSQSKIVRHCASHHGRLGRPQLQVVRPKVPVPAVIKADAVIKNEPFVRKHDAELAHKAVLPRRSGSHPARTDCGSARDCFSSKVAPSKIPAFVASMTARRLCAMRYQSGPFLAISIGFLAGVYGVTSNDTGGIIPWTIENQHMA